MTMKRFTSALILIGALGLGANMAAAPLSPARPAEDSAQAQARFRPRLSDRQVQAILSRIRTNGEALMQTIDGMPARGRVYSNRTRSADDVAYLVDDLVTAAVHLDDHISRAITTRSDVDDLLRRADLVDQALARTSQSGAVSTSWNSIRRDVDSLANAYGLTWDWQNPQYSNEPVSGVYRQLQGTYTLDVGRSDNTQRAIDAALRSASAADRDRLNRQLTNRLDPPELIAIDRNGGKIVSPPLMGRSSRSTPTVRREPSRVPAGSPSPRAQRYTATSST